jgi:hypothetical protein
LRRSKQHKIKASGAVNKKKCSQVEKIISYSIRLAQLFNKNIIYVSQSQHIFLERIMERSKQPHALRGVAV